MIPELNATFSKTRELPQSWTENNWAGLLLPGAFSRNHCENPPSISGAFKENGIKPGDPGLIRKWQHARRRYAMPRYDANKIAMALPLKTADASQTEDLSDPKIVKFIVVKKREEQAKEELTSFEEAMLPHLDAAHNLAKWLLRNEQ